MKININSSFSDILYKFILKNYNYNDNYISRKYSEKQYIEEIITVLNRHIYWSHYKGIINYKVLNNKFNEYNNLGIFKSFYNYLLNNYLKKQCKNKLKIVSIDSTFIYNKQCTNLQRNKYFKNKKGLKISSIVDINGVPLSIFCESGHIHDAKLFDKTINDTIIVNKKYIKYFLGDSGYDSNNIRNKLNELSITPIIPQNKRNIKNQNKIIIFTEIENQNYKRRIIVENYFAWIKNKPKILFVFEKNINNYLNFVYLTSSIIMFNRYIK